MRTDRGSINKGLILALLFVAVGAAVASIVLFGDGGSTPSQVGETVSNIEKPEPQEAEPPLSPAAGANQAQIPTGLASSMPPPGMMPDGLFPTPDYSVVPESMIEVEYSVSNVATGAPAGSKGFETRYSVIEAAPFYSYRKVQANLQQGFGEISIRNKHNYWTVNTLTKTARQMSQLSGPIMGYQPRIPPIPIQTSGYLGDLRFGEEIKFFKENNAKIKTEGNNEIYTLENPQVNLTLTVDKVKGTPLSLESGSQVFKSRLIYLAYKPGIKFDEKAFELTPGVKVLKSVPGQMGLPGRRWIDDDASILNYFNEPKPMAVLTYIKSLQPQDLLKKGYLENFLTALLANDSKLSSQFVQECKDGEPELQVVVAKALRACASESCKTVIATNPFNFDEAGFKEFLGVDSARLASQAAPDRLFADYLITGDVEHINKLLVRFDEQLGKVDDQSMFHRMAQDYARSLKGLMAKNKKLQALIEGKAATSKMASLTLTVQDSPVPQSMPGMMMSNPQSGPPLMNQSRK